VLEQTRRCCDRADHEAPWLARRLPGILSPLDFPEALETTQVHSVAGTLAHNGALFLDELPGLPHRVLESPRQPIKEGAVTLARSQLTLTFPARFMLAAAMNPCPCTQQLDTG
jgi:magnesium chelatase family protein